MAQGGGLLKPLKVGKYSTGGSNPPLSAISFNLNDIKIDGLTDPPEPRQRS